MAGSYPRDGEPGLDNRLGLGELANLGHGRPEAVVAARDGKTQATSIPGCLRSKHDIDGQRATPSQPLLWKRRA